MKVSVTFHVEGTPIATVTFRKSSRKLMRERRAWNYIRRALRTRGSHWDDSTWFRERMRHWREHHNEGDTLA